MTNDNLPDPQTSTVPVVAEELDVHTREVETGRLRIDKSIEQEQRQIPATLRQQRPRVERITREVPVDAGHLPEVRQENGVTIVPVLEERLVVEKRLVLKEEIHIYLDEAEQAIKVPVTLRKERVTINRTDEANNNRLSTDK